MSTTLIRNGRVVTATDDYVADVLLQGGIVQAIGRDMAAGYLAGEGAFESRAHIVALTFGFLFDFAALVERWARWAATEVSSWPAGAPPARPDLGAFARALAGEEATPPASNGTGPVASS